MKKKELMSLMRTSDGGGHKEKRTNEFDEKV